jgi:hypothetical protein
MDQKEESQLEKSVNHFFKSFIEEVKFLNNYFPKNMFRYTHGNNEILIFYSEEKKSVSLNFYKKTNTKAVESKGFNFEMFNIKFNPEEVHEFNFKLENGSSIEYGIGEDKIYDSPKELFHEFFKSCCVFKLGGYKNRFYEAILLLYEEYGQLKKIRTNIEKIKEESLKDMLENYRR